MVKVSHSHTPKVLLLGGVAPTSPTRISVRIPGDLCKQNKYVSYPLVMTNIAIEIPPIFHGKIHYFYGHFQ
jgi:hypothetical protein